LSDGEATRSPFWKRVAQGAVSLVVVVGIFVGVLPRIAGYGDVWDTIISMTGLELWSLAAIGLWNLVTYWFVLTAALPGLRFREASVVNQASTAVSNTLPAGGALGVGVTVAMLTSWGFRGSAIGLQAIVSGVWNNFVKLGMPVVALVLLALEGGVTAGRALAALAGIAVLVVSVAVFALLLRSDRFARSAGRRVGAIVNRARRLFGRPAADGFEDRISGFRRQTIDLLSRRWGRLTVATLVSHVSLYLVLLVALRHVGIDQSELSWIAVLAAFAFVRLISALPITPGGVGVVELGYAAVLTIGMEETLRAQVVAAVLLFRAITYFLPIPLGAVSYVVWRRNRSWRLRPEERDLVASR
jgi:uncharacterized protein (TIRG00374 family)